jgi:hypothetical protein
MWTRQRDTRTVPNARSRRKAGSAMVNDFSATLSIVKLTDSRPSLRHLVPRPRLARRSFSVQLLDYICNPNGPPRWVGEEGG